MTFGIGGISRGSISSAPIGAGVPSSSGYSLTATGISTPAPLVDSPFLASGANSSLTATGIATAAPLVDSPAGTQDQVLSASDLVGAAPVVGGPAAANGINYSGTANDLVVGSPVIGSPAGTYAHQSPVIVLQASQTISAIRIYQVSREYGRGSYRQASMPSFLLTGDGNYALSSDGNVLLPAS